MEGESIRQHDRNLRDRPHPETLIVIMKVITTSANITSNRFCPTSDRKSFTVLYKSRRY